MGRQPPVHHGPNGLFRNPPGSPERDAPLSAYLQFFARRTLQSHRRIAVPPGLLLPAEEARDAWYQAGDDERLLWLGHASFLLRIGGRTILVDPFLSDVAGPGRFGPKRFSPPGLPIAFLPPIDLLVISHNHYDHLDAATLRRLPRRDAIDVVVPLGLGPFFHGMGFNSVTQVDWYDCLPFGDLALTAVPAVHWSKRGFGDECRSLWAGYLFDSPDARLYYAADTAYGPVFEEIGGRLGPVDIALVGIGAYEPRAVMKASHATPEEAVRIAREVGAREVFGMHWGAVVLSDEDPFEPPRRFEAAAARAGYASRHIWRLAIGETRKFAQETRAAARAESRNVEDA